MRIDMQLKGVRINLPGINAVMKSPGVQALIDEKGGAIARRAGPDYEYVRGSRRHKWVARGFVQTANFAGALDNAKRNTLLKAL